MEKKDPQGRTTQERAEYCQAEAKFPLSIGCIRSRISRGWSDDRIINTSADTKHRPGMNHPFKRKTYNRVARKKGWEETPQ